VYSVEKASGSSVSLKFFRPSDGSEAAWKAQLEGSNIKIEKGS